MEEKTLTISRTDLQSYTQGLAPALQFCSVVLKSGIAPTHFKTPEALYVAILYGQELGFSPMQSINCIYVIQNKPSLEASGIKALVADKGGTITPAKWDDLECTLKMTRPGWTEQSFTYTYEMAKAAGLAGKDNWNKHRMAMLYARCVSILARNMFPDVLKGFYSKEEMLDSIEVSPAPILIDNAKILRETKAEVMARHQKQNRKLTTGEINEHLRAPIQNNQQQANLPLEVAEEKEKQIQDMVFAFEELGVNHHQIDKLFGKSVFDFDDENMSNARRIYGELKSGKSKAQDYFEEV